MEKLVLMVLSTEIGGDKVGQYEFWIITSGVMILISLLIYFIRRQMTKRDVVEKELIVALDSLKDAISQLKLSLGTLSSSCYERHKALDREVEEMKDDINRLQK